VTSGDQRQRVRLIFGALGAIFANHLSGHLAEPAPATAR
jgi:hypothetical protein